MVAPLFYNGFLLYLGNNEINLNTHSFKMALMAPTFSYNAAHTNWSQVAANEIANVHGYTAGGKAILSQSFALVGATAVFDGADLSWTATGGSIGPASYAVLYDDTSANDRLVLAVPFGENKTAGDGTDFRVVFNTSGIIGLAFV